MKFRGQVATIVRSVYVVEHTPLCLLEIHGRVREQATGLRGDYSPEVSYKPLGKGKDKVALLTTPPHESSASYLRERLCRLLKRFR